MIKNKNSGFTLIEIMIVVAVLGILTAIALPSYTEHVRKGKRADAKVELLRIAQLQESYFVQNLSYAQDLTANAGGLGLGSTVKSEQEQYTITVSAKIPSTCTGVSGTGACTGYTLTATANGAQANDDCKNFTLTNTGVKGRTGSGITVARCWQ